MTENKKKFFEILESKECGIFPDCTPVSLALGVLVDYLLGEDYYIIDPLSSEQCNTIIVDAILNKYSKQYRKDIKKLR